MASGNVNTFKKEIYMNIEVHQKNGTVQPVDDVCCVQVGGAIVWAPEYDAYACGEGPCPHCHMATDGVHRVAVARCFHPDRAKWVQSKKE